MELNKIKTSAFTLIELLVVIAIIGILSGLIIVGMSSSINSATLAKTQIFSASLRDSLLANLISEWKLDNISGTVDSALANGTTITDTWGNINGTTSNGPTLRNGNNCIYGQCLQFNGTTNYVGFGNPILNTSNQMTLGAWVKFTGLDYSGSTGVLNSIIGKGYPDTPPGTPSSGFWFSYDNRTNGNSFHYTCFGNSAGGYGGGSNNFPYGYNFSNNTWYYLSFTIDASSNARLYINGSQYGATVAFSNLVLPDTTSNLNIGASSAGSSFFKGSLDEIRIYNASMPTSQIKDYYYSGLSRLLAKGEINKEDYLNGIR